MKRVKAPGSRSILARASIWTIVNHDFLAGHIRNYIWGASATVFALCLAHIIPLHTALYILIFSGFGSMVLLWFLIQWRKAILLNIRDEELRRTAHAAMLALIHARQTGSPGVENPHRHHPHWFKKKSHYN
jgi:hypothetical protein